MLQKMFSAILAGRDQTNHILYLKVIQKHASNCFGAPVPTQNQLFWVTETNCFGAPVPTQKQLFWELPANKFSWLPTNSVDKLLNQQKLLDLKYQQFSVGLDALGGSSPETRQELAGNLPGNSRELKGNILHHMTPRLHDITKNLWKKLAFTDCICNNVGKCQYP